jgi:alpha-glucosidase
VKTAIQTSMAAFAKVGAAATWVLSNHDVIRHASRLGLDPPPPQGDGLGPKSEPKPDAVLGLRRARALTLLMLALPGSAYLYQGEELGLPEDDELPDSARQDPSWFRTNHKRYGRDGCRVPIPWEADAPAYGFSPTGKSWLPQPKRWARLARDRQPIAAGNTNTLSMYSWALELRQVNKLGTGTLAWLDGYGDDVVAFTVTTHRTVTVVSNLGASTVRLPAIGAWVHSELPFPTQPITELEPNTAIWMSAD